MRTPISGRYSSAGLPSTRDTTTEATALARAYALARHATSRQVRRSLDDPSDDGFFELTGAVRAFVIARADGAPPERVLAEIKGALRPAFIQDADDAHDGRLQALILNEFLASYYGVLDTAAVVSASPE